jgi:hypothetical protein
MSAVSAAPPRRWRWAGGAAVLVFAALVLRFWHPVYGFTRFLQVDAAKDATNLPAFRAQPIYLYRNTGGYDGQYYAQIAYDPTIRTSALRTAVDNLQYRARRILPSMTAYVLAGGRPAAIASLYAVLNPLAWLALAGLVWRLLPVTDARSFAAWCGVLFSAGTLAAVRYALTDLIALALTAAALGWSAGFSSIFLALAALSRETALLALPALWTRPWFSRRNAAATAVAAAPILLWLVYLRWQLGPGDAGLRNFAWPLQGWAEKVHATIRAFAGREDPLLVGGTLLAVIGVSIQAGYCLMLEVKRTRPLWDDPWGRVGLIYSGLLLCLGTAVWEGFPGAAFRAVLPLTLATNLVMIRRRAAWGWLAGANLGVIAGVVSLLQVPDDPGEIAAAHTPLRRVVAQSVGGWYGTEHTRKHRWAWAGGDAVMRLTAWPRSSGTVRCVAALRSLAGQEVSITQGSRVCWSGTVAAVGKSTAAWDVTLEDGQATLVFHPFSTHVDQPSHAGSASARIGTGSGSHGRDEPTTFSTAEPTLSSAPGDPRALAFALYDLKMTDPDVRTHPR